MVYTQFHVTKWVLDSIGFNFTLYFGLNTLHYSICKSYNWNYKLLVKNCWILHLSFLSFTRPSAWNFCHYFSTLIFCLLLNNIYFFSFMILFILYCFIWAKCTIVTNLFIYECHEYTKKDLVISPLNNQIQWLWHEK